LSSGLKSSGEADAPLQGWRRGGASQTSRSANKFNDTAVAPGGVANRAAGHNVGTARFDDLGAAAPPDLTISVPPETAVPIAVPPDSTTRTPLTIVAPFGTP
jgi:hypothetical protein